MLVSCKDTSVTSGLVIRYAEENGRDVVFMGRLAGKHIKNMDNDLIAWGESFPLGSRIRLQTLNEKGTIKWKVEKKDSQLAPKE